MTKKTIKKDVIVTDDYDELTLLPENRNVSEQHKNSIKESITSNGSWIEDEPIVVNEDLEIVDGQHRYEAHKELGLPIAYMIMRDATIDTARIMNLNRRNWTLLDWADSYRKSGRLAYKLFFELMEQYPSYPPMLIIAACHQRPLAKGMLAEFKSGDFKLTPETMVEASVRLDQLGDIGNAIPDYIGSANGRFLLYMFNLPSYRHDRMLTKLGQVDTTNIKPSNRIMDTLSDMDRIYNRSEPIANMVRFI